MPPGATEEQRAEAARPRAPRFEYLDGIRALAALFVLVHHSWLAVYPGFPRNDGPSWLGWMLYGHMAVSVFIVVSGFSLTIAPARNGMHTPGSARQFFGRRGWRILPTYWAALAFSCLVYGVVTADQTGSAVDTKAIVVHSLLLQDVVDSAKPNGAFWSIAVEWQIYFLFPLMLLLCRRYGPRWTVSGTAVAVVVGYLLAVNFTPFERFLNITPQYIVLFAMGVLAAALLRHPTVPPLTRYLLPLSGALALTFVALCWRLGSVWVVAHFFWADLLVGAAVASFVGALAMGHGRRSSSLLGTPALAGVGGYSYSIYLIHAPLLWLVWHFAIEPLDLSPTLELAALIGAAAPVVLLASWGFYRVFEKPFLTRRSWAAWRAVLLRGHTAAEATAPRPRAADDATAPRPRAADV